MTTTQLGSIFSNLEEEATWTRNDLDTLSRIAWYLDEMRGNCVPRDLFIRVRGSLGQGQPWDVRAYAEASAVESYHRDERDGHRLVVVTRSEETFTLAFIRDSWTTDAA